MAKWYLRELRQGSWGEWIPRDHLTSGMINYGLIGYVDNPQGYAVKAGDEIIDILCGVGGDIPSGEPTFLRTEPLKLVPGDTTEYTLVLTTLNYTGSYWFRMDISIGEASECEDNADCPEGEKCVEGECVPCDEVVDGVGIVTLWGSDLLGNILTDGLSIDLSNSPAIVNLDQFEPLFLRSGRIQIPNGFKGTLTVKAGVGFMGADFGATIDLFTGSVDGFYQDFIFDSGKLPFAYTFTGKVVFELLNYDTLGDCADELDDDTPDDPPDDPLDDTDDDLDDIIDDPIDEIEDDEEDDQPIKPETGCECEIYIGDQIARASDAITSGLNMLKSQFAVGFEGIRSEINQQTAISREFVLFSKNQLLQALTLIYFELRSMRSDIALMRVELESIHDEIESIDDTLQKGLILPECAPEAEKGLVEVFDEFSKKYEPVDVVVEESDVWQHSPDEAPRNYPRKF